MRDLCTEVRFYALLVDGRSVVVSGSLEASL